MPEVPAALEKPRSPVGSGGASERSPLVPPPCTFREIFGQERVWRYLGTAMKSGRLAHAYLFVGPDGVGKESAARALAAALNCDTPLEDGDACGICPSCRRLQAGTHPDFLVLRPSSRERPPKITIEQIREFRRQTAYAPLGGGWRVALLKPGEDLREEAANALLKTLEEPPARHLLVITAGVEADLFPTVVSRCQKLAFAPLPFPLIQAELERRGLPPERAAILAAVTGGSLGQALALDPEDFFRQRQQVLAALKLLREGKITAALDWAQALAKKERKTSPEEGEEEQRDSPERKSGSPVDTFLRLAQLWYRDLLLVHLGAPARLLAYPDCLEELRREAAAGQREKWLARLAALNLAQRHLRANLNVELTLDLLAFRLMD